MSEIVATLLDNGKPLDIRLGDTILVRLPESPTTGYRWAIAQANQEILTLGDTDFMLDPGVGVGGGGLRTFRFLSLKSGTAKLELKRWREWEGDRSITERYHLTVRVL